MHFSTTLTILSLAISTLAAPLDFLAPRSEKRAGTSAAVVKVQTYNEFSVSSGVSGNALAEVNAKFPIDLNNLAGVAASDLAIISKAAQVAEDAETGKGGFDDAIAAAGDKSAAGIALQNGKIKNKVLKLQTSVLQLQIEIAQGKSGLASKLATQQGKLNKDVGVDAAAKGQKATAISFSGSD